MTDQHITESSGAFQAPGTNTPSDDENLPMSSKTTVNAAQDPNQADISTTSRQRSHSLLMSLSNSRETLPFWPNEASSPKPKDCRLLLSSQLRPAVRRSSPSWHHGLRVTRDNHQDIEPLVTPQEPVLDSSMCSFGSGGDVCRICHEGEETGEELVSPCHCTGSVGLLHLSCLEKWLGTSQTTRCELCKFQFMIKKTPRPVTEFMQDPPSKKHRQNLICDLACFCILTPVTVVGTYVCANGAIFYSKRQNSWQLQGLAALVTCLLLVYVAWLVVVIHHNYVICRMWRQQNHLVKIIYMSPIKSQRTIRSPSTASFKPRGSAFSSPRGSDAQSVARGSVSIHRGSVGTPRSSLSTPRNSVSPPSSSISSPRRSVGSPQSSLSPPRSSPDDDGESIVGSPRSLPRVSFDTSPSYDTSYGSPRKCSDSPRGRLLAESGCKRARSSRLSAMASGPFLRPILKYSSHLKATSWQSLDDFDDAAIMENRAMMELGLPPDHVITPWIRTCAYHNGHGSTPNARGSVASTAQTHSCSVVTLMETCV